MSKNYKYLFLIIKGNIKNDSIKIIIKRIQVSVNRYTNDIYNAVPKPIIKTNSSADLDNVVVIR